MVGQEVEGSTGSPAGHIGLDIRHHKVAVDDIVGQGSSQEGRVVAHDQEEVQVGHHIRQSELLQGEYMKAYIQDYIPLEAVGHREGHILHWEGGHLEGQILRWEEGRLVVG